MFWLKSRGVFMVVEGFARSKATPQNGRTTHANLQTLKGHFEVLP
jgi:hypothetical protein